MLLRDFVSACAAYVVVFFLARGVLPRGDNAAAGMKVDAWILTGVNSLLTSVGALPVVWSVCRRIYGSKTLEEAMEVFEVAAVDETWWTRTLVILFAAYCVMDLAMGALFYRPLVDPATGYAHHTFWFVISICGLYLGVTPALCLGFLQEVPVVILSLGSIYPPWRLDRTFGILYFMMRLVYHTALCGFTLRLLESLWIAPTVALLSLLVNIYWWSGWISSQISTAHVLHHKEQAENLKAR